MIWFDAKNCVPDKLGQDGFVDVLCKVKTKNKSFKHAVLRFDENGCWWLYLPELGHAFQGGWVGIGDLEVLEWAYIED